MKAKNELSYHANELRRRFGEDLSSPIDVFAILGSQERITLVFYPLSEQISGMCVRTKYGDQLVAINSTLSYGRQRFTAAHELYHLFIQKEIQSIVCGKEIGSGNDEEEKNADGFASFFLAPNDALRSYIEKNLLNGAKRPLSLEDVVHIEQYFRMSRHSTLYRLVGDGFISLEFANTLKSGIISSARKLGYSDDLYIPSAENRKYFTSGAYIEMVEKLNSLDLISNGKYEGLLLDAYRADMVYNLETQGQETND